MGNALADGAARQQNLVRLAGQGGNHLQHHHQQQRQRRNHIAEQGGEFIAGEHGAVAAEPQQHHHHDGTQRHAVVQRFQGVFFPKVGKKNGFSAVVHQGIDQGEQQKYPHHAPQHFEAPPPVEQQIVASGANAPGGAVGGMLKGGTEANGTQEKQKIHRRMTGGKGILIHVRTPIWLTVVDCPD